MAWQSPQGFKYSAEGQQKNERFSQMTGFILAQESTKRTTDYSEDKNVTNAAIGKMGRSGNTVMSK